MRIAGAMALIVTLASQSELSCQSRFSYAELRQAVIDGNKTFVAQRLDEGLSPEGYNLENSDPSQPSLFELAMEKGQIPIVELFLQHGKNPNELSFWRDRTLIYVATELNNESLIKLLLDYGADPLIVPESMRAGAEDRGPLLDSAIREQNNRYLQLCLDKGVSPDARYESLGWEPLINISIKANNPEAMKLLLNYGADVTVANMYNHYMTTLALAIEAFGMTSDSVKLLLEKGADKIRYVYDRPYPGHATTDRLRVRKSPNLDGMVVGFLRMDEQVQMLEVSPYSQEIDQMNYPWVRIRTKKIEGWVFGGYIEPTITTPGLN